MNCPVCKDVDLVMTDRQGVEIDYCPRCRGVWLDRGELDKIIERSARYESGGDLDFDADDEDGDARRRGTPPPSHHDPRPYPPPHYPQKRKSFWSELFD